MLPPKKYGKLPLIPLSPPQSSSATLSPDQPDLGKGYSSWTYLADLEFNWLVVGYMILALDQAKEGSVVMLVGGRYTFVCKGVVRRSCT